MATTKRDGIARREKRGPSPANSNIIPRPRSTKNSTSPLSAKQAPNNLRPTTVTSRIEPSKNAKKPGSVSDQDTSAKPAAIRRRSLDRADLCSAPANKSLISPGPKNNTPRTQQSVSSSKSSTFSPKPTVERTSKPPKAAAVGKPQMLSSWGSMKKPTTVVITKKDSGSKKAPSTTIHDTKQVIKVVTKNEFHHEPSPVHDVEEVIKVENEVEVLEMPKSHIENELEVVNAEVKSVEEVDRDTICDIGSVSEEEGFSQIDEIDEDILQGEKSDPEDHPKGEENAKNDGDYQEGIETGDEEKREENEVDEKEDTNDDEENNRVAIENKEVDEGNQKLTEEAENKCPKEPKLEAVNVVAKRPAAVVQGKKESATPYNDVIEETASKLLEKRKNKVKALAGAFQTVIDYETAASNKS